MGTRLSPHAKPFVPLHLQEPEPEPEEEEESDAESEEEDEDEKVPESEPEEYGMCQLMSFACMFILLWMCMTASFMNQQQLEVAIDYVNTVYPPMWNLLTAAVAFSKETASWSTAFYCNTVQPQMLHLLTAAVAFSKEAVSGSTAFYWNTVYPQMLQLLAYFKATVYPQLLEHTNHVAGLVSKTVCG